MLIYSLIKKLAVLGLLVSLSASAQHGALPRQLSLQELTARSAIIVHGQVVSAEVENHPTFQHLRTVVVTIRVSETLKGSAQDTFTFREFLWGARPDQRTVPSQYQPGKELLLMMRAANRYGLSSPAGLEQGTFRITRSKDGQAYAVNGRNNMQLFSGSLQALGSRATTLTKSASSVATTNKPGAVRLQDLKEVITRLSEVQ